MQDLATWIGFNLETVVIIILGIVSLIAICGIFLGD